MEIHIFLQSLQINRPCRPDLFRIIGLEFVHDLTGPRHYPHNTGRADKHMMGFFGKHKLAGPCQRVKAGFGKR